MDLKKEIVNNRIKVCGLRMKELRTSKNLSLAAFAATVGSSASAIRRYEENIRIPDLQILAKIASVYNVTLEWLTGGDATLRKHKPPHLSHFRNHLLLLCYL